MSLDLEAEWIAHKVQVKADLNALLDQGIPLNTARRMVGWNITLEYSDFADVTAWPPPLVTPSPNPGIRESLRILVSRSSDRVNVGNLQGAQLDAGVLYAIFIPDIPELGIIGIDFLLNGSPHHSEASAPWDYNGTNFDSSASRVTFIAGEANISANITDSEGTFSIDATFNVE